jgi:hypothetical protein
MRKGIEESQEDLWKKQETLGEPSIEETADGPRIALYCRHIPGIIVNDFSRKEDPAETSWRTSFIRASTSLAASIRTTQEDDSVVIQMLRDTLKSAEEEDGPVPTSHIDHLYDCSATSIGKPQG